MMLLQLETFNNIRSMATLHRNKEWRDTLDKLMEETGIGIVQIAEYIGVPYNEKETSFYAKLPQKRKKFIGVGMALGQPLEVINDWILKYSGKRRLYIKDISEDLVWIYLIGLNYRYRQQLTKDGSACVDAESDSSFINYFRMYEECQNAAYITFRQMWDEVILNSLDTSDLEVKLEDIRYDEKFEGLREFILDNMDSFKTAYTKPRKMLDGYVKCILKGLSAGRKEDVEQSVNAGISDNRNGDSDVRFTSRLKLNWLRGSLDDSMINYLSGNSETHHVIDRNQGVRVVSTKHIPVSRKTHISMCLALGMTGEEINQYLGLMGFAPLKQENNTERILVEALKTWEKAHPLQSVLKNMCIDDNSEETTSGCEKKTLSSSEMYKAAESMLQMRLDIRDEFARQGLAFPYYNERRKGK